MSSIESPELKTMNAHSQELTTVLSSDPVCVARALIDKKFIQEKVVHEVITGRNTRTGRARKATILVESVRKEIEAAPEKLTQFLEILSEQSYAKEVVESLHSTYQSEFLCGSILLYLGYASIVQTSM